jgi:hypothetical protein
MYSGKGSQVLTSVQVHAAGRLAAYDPLPCLRHIGSAAPTTPSGLKCERSRLLLQEEFSLSMSLLAGSPPPLKRYSCCFYVEETLALAPLPTNGLEKRCCTSSPVRFLQVRQLFTRQIIPTTKNSTLGHIFIYFYEV